MTELNKIIRLQKYLSSQGVCSRRNAEDMIRRGDISINGVVATLGDRVSGGETILVKGKEIEHQIIEKKFIAWNKPIGVEVTLSPARDKDYKTLLDFDFGPQRVFPIGRLDKDSHGLLVLTNDGEFANELMHPRYEKEKEYLVKIYQEKGSDSLEDLAALMSKGLTIEGERTSPCVIEVLDSKTLKFILKEGRNRQIRKMCEAMDLRVVDLKRIRFGALALGNLKEAEWREVKKEALIG